MIVIGNVLVSDEIVQEQFVCDLNSCKGGCCEDGDAGAPLEKQELAFLPKMYEAIRPYLTEEGIREVERQGFYNYDPEFGWVTPTIGGNLCAYGKKDKHGIIKCGIEQAYNDGKITWKKPISCHMFPIRIKSTKEHDMLNYEPREDLCKAGCSFGKKLKVPVYTFLKEPLIRKYGEDFYEALESVATDYFEAKSVSKT
ncbi:MAG: DUF3109 family protein [Chitinophagaceae bacterium]|nr:DUF3109 family protein [Chitinophagaceae bacterium]